MELFVSFEWDVVDPHTGEHLGRKLAYRKATSAELVAAVKTLMVEPDYEAIRQGVDMKCTHEGHTMWFDRPGAMGDMMGQGPGDFCDHCVALRGFDRRKVLAAALAGRVVVSTEGNEDD